MPISDCAELWPCYLEKALVAHCGGWNDIGSGGKPSHVLEILTGCPNAYDLTLKDFACCGNSAGAKRGNSVQKRKGVGRYRKPWPSANGKPVVQPKTQDGCIDALYAYDKANYPMCCFSARDGNTAATRADGFIDIPRVHAHKGREERRGERRRHVARSEPPRNERELTRGRWVDDGPGWKKHPEIQKALRPVFEDDGAFWVEKSEFFEYVDSIACSRWT